MVLHGQVRMNNQVLMSWEAQRVEPEFFADRPNTYACVATWNRGVPEDAPSRHVRTRFELRHRYRDGATALAAKVMERAAQSAPPFAFERKFGIAEKDPLSALE